MSDLVSARVLVYINCKYLQNQSICRCVKCPSSIFCLTPIVTPMPQNKGKGPFTKHLGNHLQVVKDIGSHEVAEATQGEVVLYQRLFHEHTAARHKKHLAHKFQPMINDQCELTFVCL